MFLWLDTPVPSSNQKTHGKTRELPLLIGHFPSELHACNYCVRPWLQRQQLKRMQPWDGDTHLAGGTSVCRWMSGTPWQLIAQKEKWFVCEESLLCTKRRLFTLASTLTPAWATVDWAGAWWLFPKSISECIGDMLECTFSPFNWAQAIKGDFLFCFDPSVWVSRLSESDFYTPPRAP